MGWGRDVAREQQSRRRWNRIGWGYSLIFVVALAFLAGTLVYEVQSGDTVTLQVTNAYTGEAISGAAVVADGKWLGTNQSGVVRLDRPDSQIPIEVRISGYEMVSGYLEPDSASRQTVALRPTTLQGKILDDQTDEPIAGAVVAAVIDEEPDADVPTTTTGADGSFQLDDVPADARLRVDAGGDYGVQEEPIGERTQLDLALRITVFAGVVTDEAGDPIQGAVVRAGDARAVSIQDGTFRLTNVPEDTEIIVAAPGFAERRLEMPADGAASVSLEKMLIKAIYLDPYITHTTEQFERLVDLINRTELNAIVMDIKQDTIYYDSNVQFFQDAGIVQPLYDLDARMEVLKEHNIYTIARMVVFQDSLVAMARPDLAVLHNETGELWQDVNGVSWVNPMEPELWEANAELAVEAANRGFDEIQFDYVRFPTDGDLTTMDFGQPNTEETRTDAIVQFLTLSRERLEPTGAMLAADVFGFTLLVNDDLGIGQNVELIAPLVDFLCPMIYPSHFPDGSLAVDGHPNDFPYETIAISMHLAATKLPGMELKVRPWLQDFSLGGLSPYGDAEVRAQIDAAEDSGASGWMLWDPNNRYHEGALEPAVPVDEPVATPPATPLPATPVAPPVATPIATPVVTPPAPPPVATPIATPIAVDPVVSPAATPEATPDATPVATPAATPEATPRVSPEAARASPVSVATPTASPTPAVARWLDRVRHREP